MSEDRTESSSKPTEITAEMIRAVRTETRAGTLDCKNALKETNGDVAKAIELVRSSGKTTPKKVWT
jgi:translation elongation factor EF-Ts